MKGPRDHDAGAAWLAPHGPLGSPWSPVHRRDQLADVAVELAGEVPAYLGVDSCRISPLEGRILAFDAGRASGLPAPVSVRHGKPKDRRRPRLPADGSGNQCLRRTNFGGSIVHSVTFRGSRPRGIAAPGDVGEPLTQSPVGMSGPRRNRVAGLPARAGHVAACTAPSSQSARQVPTHPPQYLDKRAGGRALRYAAGSPINLGGYRLI